MKLHKISRINRILGLGRGNRGPIWGVSSLVCTDARQICFRIDDLNVGDSRFSAVKRHISDLCSLKMSQGGEVRGD